LALNGRPEDFLKRHSPRPVAEALSGAVERNAGSWLSSLDG
jgi:hypothetical protein